jgi:hypothetical protein
MSLSPFQAVLNSNKNQLFSKPGVVAVGIGYKQVNNKTTPDLCIICSVIKKKDASELSPHELIPKKIGDVLIYVIESGEIVVFEDRQSRIRPVPGGVSIGHRAVTAGTLGVWVKKEGLYHLLSNNHVIANSNNADKGDPILQPGSHDSGDYPRDVIAELSEFIPIKFGGASNLIDAAIARPVETENGDSSCSFASAISRPLNALASVSGRKTRLKPVKIFSADDVVRDEILDIGKVNEITEAELDMKIKKSGRTTGLTEGKVTQVYATVKVNYGIQSAWFDDQIITTDISKGGDSGSLVVTQKDNKAVGLLFAGSDVMTICNRIQNVFSALEISF